MKKEAIIIVITCTQTELTCFTGVIQYILETNMILCCRDIECCKDIQRLIFFLQILQGERRRLRNE